MGNGYDTGDRLPGVRSGLVPIGHAGGSFKGSDCLTTSEAWNHFRQTPWGSLQLPTTPGYGLSPIGSAQSAMGIQPNQKPPFRAVHYYGGGAGFAAGSARPLTRDSTSVSPVLLVSPLTCPRGREWLTGYPEVFPVTPTGDCVTVSHYLSLVPIPRERTGQAWLRSGSQCVISIGFCAFPRLTSRGLGSHLMPRLPASRLFRPHIVLQCPRYLAPGLPLLNILPLVVFPLTARQCQFHLGAPGRIEVQP